MRIWHCALAILLSCFLQLAYSDDSSASPYLSSLQSDDKKKGSAGKHAVHPAHSDDEKKLTKDRMPYYLEPRFEKDFERDDNKQVLFRARERISAGLNATYGVMMVATPDDYLFAAQTVPIWKAYCEKHRYDFFLQEESLVEGALPYWTKLRLLMELISQAKWKYVWMVDPQSLPVQFDKGWQILIKDHLRFVRWKDDSHKQRVVWCPEDCAKDYHSKIEEGLCYGPRASGCIFQVKPAIVVPILLMWYQTRRDLKTDPRGFKLSFKSFRKQQLFEMVHVSPVQNLIGFPDSTFLATHNSIDEVLTTLRKKPVLGEIINKRGEYKSEL